VTSSGAHSFSTIASTCTYQTRAVYPKARAIHSSRCSSLLNRSSSANACTPALIASARIAPISCACLCFWALPWSRPTRTLLCRRATRSCLWCTISTRKKKKHLILSTFNFLSFFCAFLAAKTFFLTNSVLFFFSSYNTTQ
jgi:hypothetical protein